MCRVRASPKIVSHLFHTLADVHTVRQRVMAAEATPVYMTRHAFSGCSQLPPPPRGLQCRLHRPRLCSQRTGFPVPMALNSTLVHMQRLSRRRSLSLYMDFLVTARAMNGCTGFTRRAGSRSLHLTSAVLDALHWTLRRRLGRASMGRQAGASNSAIPNGGSSMSMIDILFFQCSSWVTRWYRIRLTFAHVSKTHTYVELTSLQGGALVLAFATRTHSPPEPHTVSRLAGVVASSPFILRATPTARHVRIVGWLLSLVLPNLILHTSINPNVSPCVPSRGRVCSLEAPRISLTILFGMRQMRRIPVSFTRDPCEY